MKLKRLQPLHSNWNVPTTFTQKKVLRECDVMFNIEKRRKQKELVSTKYFRTIKNNIRIGRIKRLGKTKYHVCGLGNIEIPSFAELKKVMSSQGYTGGVMGAIKFSL